MKQITLTQPDDWHLHVRTGELLKTVIAFTAKQFGRAIIMPNLTPPITTVAQALAYREEILNSLPPNNLFNPLMTLYLTESTTLDDVKQASYCEHVHAFKLYPAGATTNSASGVKQLQAVYPVLECMQKRDIPLLIHGEVTDPKTDIFDREKIFIDTKLIELVQQFPSLRIVLEHITTREAVQFVEEAPNTIAATITPQHLMFNRNAILVGGIKPHYYCLPIIKRESHRQALVKAAISGDPKFFLGTDSAPHLQQFKESDCGCAGCFSAATAIEFYAEIFEQANALEKLEGFASFYGPDFYRLPRNTLKITLQKNNWTIPDAYPVKNDKLIPLQAGQSISWKQLPH
jgi:dihydroorotase